MNWTMLQLQINPSCSFCCTVFSSMQALTVMVRDVKQHSIDEEQLKVLLTYAEEDIHDSNRQATAFSLLKVSWGQPSFCWSRDNLPSWRWSFKKKRSVRTATGHSRRELLSGSITQLNSTGYCVPILLGFPFLDWMHSTLRPRVNKCTLKFERLVTKPQMDWVYRPSPWQGSREHSPRKLLGFCHIWGPKSTFWGPPHFFFPGFFFFFLFSFIFFFLFFLFLPPIFFLWAALDFKALEVVKNGSPNLDLLYSYLVIEQALSWKPAMLIV